MAKKPVARRRPATRKSKPKAKPKAKRPVRKKPETLRLGSVMPSLTVNDVRATLKWYRDVLGFTVASEWTYEARLGGAVLRAGTVEFMIGQDDFAKGRDRHKGEGFRLYCSTRQDLDQLAAWIKSRGGVLAHEPTDQPWGVRDFSVVDPDGYKISIAQGK